MNPRQRKFVEAYEGNAKAAAQAAGYATPSVDGARLMKNAEIVAAIARRESKNASPMIADREERFRFWSQVMRDSLEDMPVRLKASELLGKANGDFLDRVEHSGETTITVLKPNFEDCADE
jgi:phage terminase small subunit